MNGTAVAGEFDMFVCCPPASNTYVLRRQVIGNGGRGIAIGYSELVRHFLKINIVHESRSSSLKSFEDESQVESEVTVCAT